MSQMNTALSIPWLLYSVLIVSTQLKAQGVVNGSFETGIDPNTGPGLNLGLFATDNTSIPGWTVSAGTVDYIGGRWTAGDGGRCLDLSGISAGTVLQRVSGFTPGLQYEVSFLMAANPEGGSPTKSLLLSVGGHSETFSFNAPTSPSEMGWVQHRYEFTADQTTMTLAFASLNNDASGPALDGVRITTVPEPSLLKFIGIGTAALALVGRRSRPSSNKVSP